MFSFLDIIYNTVAQVSHTDVWNGRTKLFVVVASGLKVNLDGKCLGTLHDIIFCRMRCRQNIARCIISQLKCLRAGKSWLSRKETRRHFLGVSVDGGITPLVWGEMKAKKYIYGEPFPIVKIPPSILILKLR